MGSIPETIAGSRRIHNTSVLLGPDGAVGFGIAEGPLALLDMDDLVCRGELARRVFHTRSEKCDSNTAATGDFYDIGTRDVCELLECSTGGNGQVRPWLLAKTKYLLTTPLDNPQARAIWAKLNPATWRRRKTSYILCIGILFADIPHPKKWRFMPNQ